MNGTPYLIPIHTFAEHHDSDFPNEVGHDAPLAVTHVLMVSLGLCIKPLRITILQSQRLRRTDNVSRSRYCVGV